MTSGPEKVWTRRAIVDAIHAWAVEYGEPPAGPDWSPTAARAKNDLPRAERFEAASGRWPWQNTVVREFGTWNAAVSEAGFTPRAAHGGGGNEVRRREARAKREGVST